MGEPPDIDHLLDQVYGSEGSRRDQALDRAVGGIEGVIKPRHTELRQLQNGRRGRIGPDEAASGGALPMRDDPAKAADAVACSSAPRPTAHTADREPARAQPAPASTPPPAQPTQVVSGEGKELVSSRYAHTQILRRWGRKG